MIFVAMLTLSALPAVVPTAQALTAANVTVTLAVNGNTNPPGTLKVGDVFEIHTSADLTPAPGQGGTASTECPAQTTKKADLTADMRAWGGTLTESLFSLQTMESASSGNKAWANTTYTVKANPSGSNGAGLPVVTLHFTFHCVVDTVGDAASTTADVASSVNTLDVDNIKPAASGAKTASGGTRVGQTMTIALNGITDAVSGTIDLTSLGGSATTPLPSIVPGATSSSDAFTITQGPAASNAITGFPVTLTDSHGNTNPLTATAAATIDAHRPDAITVQPTIAADPNGFKFSWPKVADQHPGTADATHDISPTNGYRVVMVDSTASTTTTYTPTANGVISIITVAGSTDTVLFTPPAGTTGHSFTVSVYPEDAAGNKPAASPTAMFTNTAYNVFFNLDTPTVLGVPTYRAWPYINATWTAPNAIGTAAETTLGLWLRADGMSPVKYWNGGDPSVAANFVSDRTIAGPNTAGQGYLPFSIGIAGDLKSGTISNDSLFIHPTATFRQVGFNAKNLPTGAYTIGIDFNGTPFGSKPEFTRSFYYDSVAPLANAAGPSNKLIQPIPSVMYNATSFANPAKTDPIMVNANFTDIVGTIGTGVASYTFNLVSTAAGNPPALDANGNAATGTCTNNTAPTGWAPAWTATGSASSCAISYWANGPCTLGAGTDCILNPTTGVNATLVFPAVPAGNYQIQIKATDAAGNPTTILASPSFNLLPRVSLAETDLSRAPYIDGAGFLHAYAFAATDIAASSEWAGQCVSGVCRVGAVELQGANGAEIGKATPSTLTLDNEPIPRSAPSALVPGDGRLYYNYSHDFSNGGGLSPQTLDKNNMYVRAVAKYSFATGATTTATIALPTNWVRVNVGLPAGAFQMQSPFDDTFVNLSGDVGTMFFNTSFEQGGRTAPPGLNYTIVSNSTGLPVPFNSTQGAGVNATFIGGVLAKGPKYFYNFSNGIALPRGEYVATLKITENEDAAHTELGTITRFFAIETASPRIVFPGPPGYAQPELFSGQYVSGKFNITVAVDHGLANLSAAKIVTSLIAPNTAQGATGTRVLNQVNSEGFSAVVRDFGANETGNATWLNITVTLPSNATNGNIYSLRVNATTDSAARGATSNTTVGLATLILDTVAPSVGVFTGLANETNNVSLANAPRLHGFATDSGSGVKEVQVRVINENTSQTFVPAPRGGGWRTGVLESWMTSLPRNQSDGNLTRDVWFPLPGAAGDWVLNSTSRIAYNETDGSVNGSYAGITFDRNSTYRVDVRARDNTTPNDTFAGFATFHVAFDTEAPKVPAGAALGGLASTTVQWHETTGTLSVGAQDNNCVAMVRLTGLTPGGAVLAPVNFTRPASYGCNQTAGVGDAAATWTMLLAEHPEITTEIGVYHFTVEVTDAAGLRTTTSIANSYNVTVLDGQAPVLRSVTLEPPIISPGQPSIIRASIFENSKIDHVEVVLAEIVDQITLCDEQLHATRGCLLVNGTMRPVDGQVAANGTGTYVASSSTDLAGVSFHVGSYVWTVRPIDTNPAVTCAKDVAHGRPQDGCPQQAILLNVTNEAPTFIVQDAPVANSSFVGGTPTFTWRVLGSRITAADVHVDAGNSTANLTEAATGVTKTALPSNANVSSGFTVTFVPGAINGTAYSVQLRVSTPSGGLTSLANYSVDAIAPTVRHNVTGLSPVGGVDWAVRGTRVNLTATDGETTIVSLTYTVNSLTLPYTTNITPTGADGDWALTYAAKDAAGNTATGSVTLRLDATPPTINVSKDGDELFVLVSDGAAGVGVDEPNVTVFYTYATGTAFTPAKMTKATTNSYRVQLPGNATATGLKYYFEARDQLGNGQTIAKGTDGSRIDAAHPFIIDAANDVVPNQKPHVTITAPKEGDEFRDSITATWLASDPESARVGITVTLRDPQGNGKVLLADAENTGAHVVDLKGLAAGAYTLVVTASDGTLSDNAQVTFTVAVGRIVELHDSPPNTVQPNKQVRFTVGINPIGKTVSSANYVVTRDGVEVGHGLLVAAQGLYVGTYIPTEGGTYAVSVGATYSDGTTEPAAPLATFSVPAPPALPGASGGFPASLIALLAIALLTIALAAYGAFVRWSK